MNLFLKSAKGTNKYCLYLQVVFDYRWPLPIGWILIVYFLKDSVAVTKFEAVLISVNFSIIKPILYYYANFSVINSNKYKSYNVLVPKWVHDCTFHY